MNETDSILPLETHISRDTDYDDGPQELARFRYSSAVAHIEIASCFRDDVEPLFPLIGRLLPGGLCGC